MDWLNYQFPKSDIEKIKVFRDEQADARLKVRFIALLMVAENVDADTIQNIIGKSKVTINRWFIQYRDKGIRSLNSFQYQPKKTYLTDDQIVELVAWVKKNMPATVKEIRDHVENEYDVKYSVDAVRKLIKKKA